jgi:serine/threonine protein kinase
MTSDSEDKKICPKCQMPLEKKGSGSLTQWIKVCNCMRPNVEKSAEPPVSICATCGKRSEAGRAGTLTQWIFRADLCACQKPDWLPGNLESSADAVLDGEGEDECLDELPMDSTTFPVERYGAIRRIGMGASGTVYLCHDRLLKKKVAVKVLNNVGAEQLISFQREAKATSQFDHPNIVRVFDFGVCGGKYPYMVLEFIDGMSLDELLQQKGTIDIEEALPIFEQLCDALSYAHKQGIFHRDVKPTNILVGGTASGDIRAWLIDFGVGAFKQETTAQGKSVAGSPPYMSPDQALGLTFDERSEVYSMGCVMFEVLTGRPPFIGNSALETISLHAHEQPPSLSEAHGHIIFSEALEEMVATCLNKSPYERYANAAELKHVLHDMAENQHLTDRQTSLASIAGGGVDSPPPWTFSKAVKLLGAFFAFGIAALIFTASGALLLRSPDVNNTDTKPRKKAYQEPQLADALDTIESDTWYQGMDGLGNQGWTSGPNVRDADFSELLKEKGLTHINVSLTDFVTGEGFKYLKDRGVEEISLRSTGLTDAGLKVISEIKTVTVLRIAVAMKLTADGLKCIPDMPNLWCLDLTTMPLPDGAIESISKAKKLASVSFYNAKKIKASDIALLATLPELEYLDLSGTNLGNSVIPYLVKMKKLRNLRLSNADINDENLEMLARLPNLEILGLANNPKITDKGLLKLSSCSKLETLALNGCKGITVGARSKFKSEHPKVTMREVLDSGSQMMDSLEPLNPE